MLPRTGGIVWETAIGSSNFANRLPAAWAISFAEVVSAVLEGEETEPPPAPAAAATARGGAVVAEDLAMIRRMPVSSSTRMADARCMRDSKRPKTRLFRYFEARLDMLESEIRL